MQHLLLPPLLKGLSLGAGLIIGIGPQNAFVLRQGIKQQYLLLTALGCFICDFILIVAGVSGLSTVVTQHPIWLQALRILGVSFLGLYGLRLLLSGMNVEGLTPDQDKQEHSKMWPVLLMIVGFTFLNPQAYIDTILVLGGIGAQLPHEQHLSFLVGTLLASFIWFFALTYSARLLMPIFKKPKFWRYLDIAMAIMMWAIALSLLLK